MAKEFYHVVPVNDSKEHITNVTCKCQPIVDRDNNLIIHNSYDGREFFESDNRNIMQ